jgi:type III restriction enzyme
MASVTEEKLLLTIQEASERLNLNRSYVYAALVTPGVLPTVRIGRRRLIAARDLAEYVERLRTGHAADAPSGDMPTYRELWSYIRDSLPRRGRKAAENDESEPRLPSALEGALRSLYGSYERSFSQWRAAAENGTAGLTPPVFIVVCNNTSVSRLVYNFISGWEVYGPDGAKLAAPGQLALFSNARDGQWLPRPNTILVDSAQLESGESMTADCKKVAAHEIQEFKADYRRRFPDRAAEALTDEDLLREVMNTVGKVGKLGEQIKCVVSVSMLTEGWDANTVTHIVGVRAFGTQLLCEQVVGRGLRRISYVTNDDGMLRRNTPRSMACLSHSSPPQAPPRIPSRHERPSVSVR